MNGVIFQGMRNIIDLFLYAYDFLDSIIVTGQVSFMDCIFGFAFIAIFIMFIRRLTGSVESANISALLPHPGSGTKGGSKSDT